MRGQDVVHADLAGDMVRRARVIIDATYATGVKRLIFSSSTCIYGEVPADQHRRGLDPDRTRPPQSRSPISTIRIPRPDGFTQDPEVAYGQHEKERLSAVTTCR